MSDLNAVIKNSIDEVSDVPVADPDSADVEVTPEVDAEPVEAAPEPVEPESDIVAPTRTSEEPAVKATTTSTEDEFAKKYGISTQNAFGKENRIPYSRVKKIVGNAEKAKDEHYEKLALAEKTKWDAELATSKAANATWEDKFKNVGEFEKVMVNDKLKFLQLLTNIPGYTEIFQRMSGGQQRPAEPQVNQDPRPEPDRELSDGTRVYSDEGLDKLFQWNQRQAITQAEARVSQKFAPMQAEYERVSRERQVREYYEAQIPAIQAQINTARKWPLFSENEDKITEALKADRALSLEGAYRQVVLPQFQEQASKQPSRDEIRAEVLKELQKAPASTSASATQSRPVTQSTGRKSLETIIAEAIKPLKAQLG